MNLTQEHVFVSSFVQGHVTREEFLRQYKKLIYFFICKKKVQPDDIDDCFQDCVIEMYKCAQTFDYRPVKFSTYLLSQLKGVITKYKRDYYYWHKFHASLEEMHDATGFEPEAVIEEVHEFADKLKVAIASLTEQEKQVIIHIYFYELDFTTIAKKTHIPRGSLTSIHNRALTKMKDILVNWNELQSI